jgi:hypothetical protein
VWITSHDHVIARNFSPEASPNHLDSAEREGVYSRQLRGRIGENNRPQ